MEDITLAILELVGANLTVEGNSNGLGTKDLWARNEYTPESEALAMEPAARSAIMAVLSFTITSPP